MDKKITGEIPHSDGFADDRQATDAKKDGLRILSRIIAKRYQQYIRDQEKHADQAKEERDTCVMVDSDSISKCQKQQHQSEGSNMDVTPRKWVGKAAYKAARNNDSTKTGSSQAQIKR